MNEALLSLITRAVSMHHVASLGVLRPYRVAMMQECSPVSRLARAARMHRDDKWAQCAKALRGPQRANQGTCRGTIPNEYVRD